MTVARPLPGWLRRPSVVRWCLRRPLMPATGAAACLPLFLFVFESMNAAITAKEIADVLRGIRGEGRV